MKKKNNLSEDKKILLDKMDSQMPALPESLSPENITALVAGKKQKTPTRRVAKRFVAAAVAACLVICSFVLFDTAVYAPKIDTTGNIPHAQSYGDISALLNDYYKSENFKNRLIRVNNGTKFYAETDTAVAVEAEYSSDYAAADSAVSLKTHSETNLREAGVEEADIVKTDGEYIYASDGNKLYIVKADGAALTLSSVLRAENPFAESYAEAEQEKETENYEHFGNFYIFGDRLIIDTRRETYHFADSRYETKAGVLIYDISNKTSPVFVRELFFDGWEVSSRLVNGQLLYVSSYSVSEPLFKAEDCSTFIPAFYEKDDAKYPEATDILIADASEPDKFLTVAKLDLNSDTSVPQLLTVFGAGSDIYCNNEHLYIFMPHYAGFATNDVAKLNGDTGMTTDILSFDITGSAPVFRAKGCIKGGLLNTWSVDEYNGYLRLAATDSASFVYVLDGALKQVGVSEAIAEGEQIKSVRFSENTAYVVTFYQTDPLFVLDLSDPALPVVKGELKIPGFSEYLHPAGDGLMLGIGRGGNEDGLDGSAKLSLFDVSDPENPREVNSLVFRQAWFESDYRAFVSVGDGTFILPITYYEDLSRMENGSFYYDYRENTGAVRVGVENGAVKLVTEYRTSYGQMGTQRALFIGDTVYTLILTGAKSIFTAFGLSSGENLGTLTMPE